MKNRAFTIVELMVVLAIIAFLGGVAWSSYSSYVAKSRWAEVGPCIAEAVNRLETYRGNHGVYPVDDPWTSIDMNENCSEHYRGVIQVTDEGSKFIVAYADINKKIWKGTGQDVWYQTDRSGKQIHYRNPIDEKTGPSPDGYTVPF